MKARPAVAALVLPPAVREAIERAAVDAWPAECCGLLVGTASGDCIRATRAVPSLNLADDPRRRFEIDAQLWFDLRGALARAGGAEAIVGCYHSHPDGPPVPSARDLADAWEPGFVWIIVATERRRVLETTAWLFEDDESGRRFRPLARHDAPSPAGKA